MKCSGLPLALDTFGKALKEKNIGIWKDSLKQLKNPSAVNITELSMKLYSSLRKSYDFIRNEEAKSVFLLCSVFPYDHCIPFESLSMYVMGMRLLDRVKTWEEARYRMMNLVDILRTSSLLSESSDEYVKMHDVIRDVSIYISSREGQMSTLSYEKGVSDLEENVRRGSYRAIFANCVDFPHLKKFKYPKLELLILYNGYEDMQKHQISGTCFAGMEEVKVLDMSRMCFPQQTTSLTHSLRNLRTLCMSHCDFEDANIIGELRNLEVLRMNFCQLKELPATMSQLTQLKVLEITNCFLLVIHPNIISSMINLEVFDVLNFSGWEEVVSCKNKLIQNAKLSEFTCLLHLTFLRLNILHHNTLSDLFELKLERFHIVVGSCRKDSEHVERYLNLGITNLYLINNSDMRHLIGDQLGNRRYPNYYSSIDTLVLERMESFQSIVHMSVGRNPFNKLRVINVIDCNKLRNLFPFSIFEGLSILKEIEVSVCEMLEGLVSMKKEKATIKSGISCLKFTQVSQLTSFCSKQHPENLISFFNHQVAFPELRNLKFIGASNLKMLFNNNCLFSNSFCNLENLEIGNCNKLRYIFSPNFLTTLVSLDKLTIEGCELLEGIFETEEWINIDKESDILPKLRYVSVKRCPRLKSLFPPFIKCLERLEILDIDGPHEIFSEDKTFEIAQSNTSMFHEIVFPNLRRLSMTCIAMGRNTWMTRFSIQELFPNLKHFDFGCSDDDDWIRLLMKFCCVFSSLEEVNIRNVRKDKTGVLKSMLHFASFFVKKPVELKLHVASLITFFTNLKFLSINEIDGKHLLNSSVIKSLVNLETMKIYNCQEMIFILVEEERHDEDEDGEDEDGIIFKKLVKLELDKLPKLKSFHKGKCKLEFPCLEMLLIDKCDQMEIFSAEGIIRAPKLKRGHIRDHNISKGLPYGINECIQDQMKKDEQKENLDDFIQMVYSVSKDA